MPRQRPERASLRHVLAVPVGLAVAALMSADGIAAAMVDAASSPPRSGGWHASGPPPGDARLAGLGFPDPAPIHGLAPTVIDDPGPLAAPSSTGGLAFDQRRADEVIGASQPLLLRPGSGGRLLLQGRFTSDRTGRRSSDLGLRYHDRFHDQPIQLGLSGGLHDGSATRPDQRSLGAELRAAPVALRIQLFDDLDSTHAVGGDADRVLDGYDVEVGARLPVVRWAWLKANRFWQITTTGDAAEPSDSFSLRLAPLAPLEIETGSTSHGDERSYFAWLRLTLRLGQVP